MKLFYQYMAILFNFTHFNSPLSTTSRELRQQFADKWMKVAMVNSGLKGLSLVALMHHMAYF